MEKFFTQIKDIASLKEMLNSPENKYRIYPILHEAADAGRDYKTLLDGVSEGGAGGIVTNTTWLDTKWVFNDNNTDRLRDVTDYAKKLGFNAWMYDDYYYPSGFANGYAVKDHPEYTPVSIDFKVVTSEAEMPESIITLNVYDECLKYIGKFNGSFDNTVIAFYKKQHDEEYDQPLGKAKGHIDRLNTKAIDSFIDNALGVVDNKIGIDRFDAIFTDEPTITNSVLTFGRGRCDYNSLPLPYSDELLTEYESEWNASLTEGMLDLFIGTSKEARLTRIRYYNTLSRLVLKCYTSRVADWCKKHGTLSSGHFLLEEGLKYHVGYYADYMRVIGGQDIPGGDVLCADAQLFWKKGHGFDTACSFAGKYPSSIARLKGHNVAMLEICPVNWDKKVKENPYKEFMGLSTYIIFSGFTHYNAYGYFYIKDEAQHRVLNNYVGRLLTVLRNAVPDTSVALYYPISQTQSYFASVELNHNEFLDLLPEVCALEDSFEELSSIIYGKKLDYNIINDDALADAVFEKGLTRGLVHADTLIVPNCDFISATTLKAFEKLVQAGGRLIFINSVPKFGIDCKDEYVVDLLGSLRYEVYSLDELKNVEISDCGKIKFDCDSIYASPYKILDKRFYYVINKAEEAVTVNVSGSGTVYNPETNTYEKLAEKLTINGERGVLVFEGEI